MAAKRRRKRETTGDALSAQTRVTDRKRRRHGLRKEDGGSKIC